MRSRLASGLGVLAFGVGLFLGSGAASAQPVLDCHTEAVGSTAIGHCAGTGTFRTVATCADGSQQYGGIVYIQEGRGLSSVTCPNGIRVNSVRVITA